MVKDTSVHYSPMCMTVMSTAFTALQLLNVLQESQSKGTLARKTAKKKIYELNRFSNMKSNSHQSQ